MLLAFAVELLDDIVRVTFRDDLDMSRAHEVGEALQFATEADPRQVLIVFDASVRYVDSFTLSELLLFQRRLMPTQRRLAVHVANDNVYRVLAITDVAERLNATIDEEEALNTLRAKHR